MPSGLAMSDAGECVDVTVIIPSYRSRETLDACLASVVGQQTRHRYEVRVVHSGAAEQPIPERTRARFLDVHFCESDLPALPGRVRNRGASAAHSRWLLFLDADCVAPRNWIQTLVDTAERMDADGVGGSVANGTPLRLAAWMTHIVEFAPWMPHRAIELRSNFPSCNALYRRSAFREVGGFVEELFPAEDSVLNARLARHGARLVFHGGCAVAHVHRRGFVEALRHQIRHGIAFRHACEQHGLDAGGFERVPGVLLWPAVVWGRSLQFLRELATRSALLAGLGVCLLPLLWVALGAWMWGYRTATARDADARGARVLCL
jgi:glycosyltransferase involved in cell wall biosynthesis